MGKGTISFGEGEMDFELTEEQIAIRKAAREFAEGEFPEIGVECDLKEEFPYDVWRKACKLGMIGCFIPEEYGGLGLGVTEHCIIAIEFWRVDPGCGQCMISAVIGAEVLIEFGNENQKKTYLTQLPKGEAMMGIAITEPDAGSDTSSVTTTAVKTEKGYILNGTKTLITNGSIGEFIIVYCLTDPKHEIRHKRHSMIIVERDRKGFEATKMKEKLGLRASDTSEISFQDVEVPHENLLGFEGEGNHYLMDFFNQSRIIAGAAAVGLAQGAMERAIKYARSRRQFGKHLIEFQATRMKIAEMYTMIEAARNLVYKASTLVDKGKPDQEMTSMAKWFAGRVAVQSVDEALQIHGGYGYFGDYDISRFYRDAKILEILEGTKEIQKEILARSVLKKKF